MAIETVEEFEEFKEDVKKQTEAWDSTKKTILKEIEELKKEKLAISETVEIENLSVNNLEEKYQKMAIELEEKHKLKVAELESEHNALKEDIGLASLSLEQVNKNIELAILAEQNKIAAIKESVIDMQSEVTKLRIERDNLLEVVSNKKKDINVLDIKISELKKEAKQYGETKDNIESQKLLLAESENKIKQAFVDIKNKEDALKIREDLLAISDKEKSDFIQANNNLNNKIKEVNDLITRYEALIADVPNQKAELDLKVKVAEAEKQKYIELNKQLKQAKQSL